MTRTLEDYLLARSQEVLDQIVIAKRAGNFTLVAELRAQRSVIAKELGAIARANPPVLSVKRRFGSKLGAWRS